MKWSRAVHHLSVLAEACGDIGERLSRISDLHVTQLWTFGDVLESKQDMQFVPVALVVDLPADEVAWWSEPEGATGWARSTRMDKNPIRPWWRSAHAPVWNHRIVRPAPLWDSSGGIRQDTFDAIREGRIDSVRSEPPTPEEYRLRLDDELAVSLAWLRRCTWDWDEHQWARGGHLARADRLGLAGLGYLDVLDAVRELD